MHVPHGEAVTVDLEIEGGGLISLTQLMIWVDPRSVDGALIGEATFEIPDDVPLGYHYLHARSGSGPQKRSSSSSRIGFLSRPADTGDSCCSSTRCDRAIRGGWETCTILPIS